MNIPLQHPLPQPRRLRLALVLTLVLTLVGSSLLSGCIVVPGRHHRGDGGGRYGGDGGGRGGPVMVAPAPQVEVVGVAPGPGYIWVSGFWQPMGGRHVWVGGHWESGRGRR